MMSGWGEVLLYRGDGIWLRGDNREFVVNSENLDEAILWGTRREKLAEHVHYCARRDRRRSTSMS